MKIYLAKYFFVGLLVAIGSPLYAEEVPTCPRCQLIREENAKKGPPEYKYYDDYLRAEEAKKEAQHEKNSELEAAKVEMRL